jgi:hypothetical protein
MSRVNPYTSGYGLNLQAAPRGTEIRGRRTQTGHPNPGGAQKSHNPLVGVEHVAEDPVFEVLAETQRPSASGLRVDEVFWRGEGAAGDIDRSYAGLAAGHARREVVDDGVGDLGFGGGDGRAAAGEARGIESAK